MPLILYFHPLSSFCHKVLLALYENGTAFEGRAINIRDRVASAEFFAFWPMGKIPLLRDETRGRTIPETTIMLEYLDRHYPGPVPMFPRDPEAALEARF